MNPGPVVVVDIANVMGSRADGWWRDRPAAARRLVEQVRTSAVDDHEVVLVLEGAARSGTPPCREGRVHVVHADRDGDEAVVDQVRLLTAQGRDVMVVTADRELRARVGELGAQCRGPRWLLDQLV